MIILADESVDAPIVERLRRDGYTVESIAEMTPSVSDDIVLDRANRTNAILMTGDKDFGEMVFRLGHASSGVILVRLEASDAAIQFEPPAILSASQHRHVVPALRQPVRDLVANLSSSAHEQHGALSRCFHGTVHRRPLIS